MDILIDAVKFYKDISSYKFTFLLGKSGTLHNVVIRAREEHFPHLLGLNKLKDIDSIFSGKGKNFDKSSVVRRIENKEISLESIQKSSFFTHKNFEFSVENRISFFPKLKPLFTGENIADEASFIFIKKNSFSNIEADYLLRLKIVHEQAPCYLNFFLKKDNLKDPHDDCEYYIPISFFPRLNQDYEKRQPRLTLLQKSRNKDDVEENLYIRPEKQVPVISK